MIKGIKSGIQSFFRGRRLAYKRVLNKDNPDVQIILKDLARFCRAHSPTFHKDERIHASLEGRREVWLRIQENLELTENEIYALHGVKNEQAE
jgi:hypothetical protein